MNLTTPSYSALKGSTWYLKRLAVMGPHEIIDRIRERLVICYWHAQHQFSEGKSVKRYSLQDIASHKFCVGSEPRLPDLSWNFHAETENFKNLLSGKLNLLGHEWTWKTDPTVWHQAPDTNRQWPQVFFHKIPYREENPFGDIRIAWEPSRLQHLIPLALQARASTPEEQQRIVSFIESQLISWVAANPPLTGIHYVSAMECALRLIASLYTVDLIREWLTQPQQVWPLMLSLVETHAEFIRRRISKHSSAGNHTIAEATGLIYAGVLFPEMRGAKTWVTDGLELLKTEASHQIREDGGGTEEAFWYLRFISDLYGLALTLLRHYKHPLPLELERAFERSQRFLIVMMSPRTGKLPNIGDSDNGYALSPYLQFISRSTNSEPGMTMFEQTNYTTICGYGSERLLFNHGSLGMSPCYAHGHADALSVVLDIGDHQVLLDPGTYRYTGHPNWRQYFRGTRAHNTVTVNQEDQAVQETAFIWSQPYTATCIHREELANGQIRLLAYHSGYVQRFGVTHWRGVVYDPQQSWRVWDLLTGIGDHELELNWHFAMEPACQDNTFVSRITGDAFFSLQVNGGTSTVHHGETSPIRGWQSPQYGTKEPCTTLSVKYHGSLPHEFHTQLWLGTSPATKTPAHTDQSIEFFRQIVHEAQAN